MIVNHLNFKKSLFKHTITAFTIAIIFIFIFIVPSIGANDFDKKNILVMHSYHQGYKWTDSITEGIESIFGEEKEPYRLKYEYMDSKQYYSEDYINLLYDLYSHKFKNSKFDIIISSDDNAFNFLLKYREDLFPDTPVVFCGVNYFQLTDIKGHHLFTGVNEEADIAASIGIALKLHPTTQKLYIINDTTPTGKKLHPILKKVKKMYERSIEVNIIEDISMEALQKTIANLSDDSLVYYTIFFKDNTGKFFEFDDSISLIKKVCQVPLYGTWDFSLNHGIIGGMLTSGYFQGNTAAKMARRVLQGEDIENIPPVLKSPNRYMFDYNEFNKFGIKISDLPENSVILNTPRSFYAEYKSIFWTVISVVSSLVFFISILVLNLNKRLKLEKALGVANEKLIRLYENEKVLKREAMTANRAKTNFLMNMSHELRTPLNGVLAASELISSCDTKDSLEDIQQIIKSSSYVLLQNVEAILAFTKSKDGNLELMIQPFKLNDMLNKLKTRFVQKGTTITLKLNFEIYNSDIPNVLMGDEARLVEIFNHILENAAKFCSSSPEVRLSITIKEKSAQAVTLIFSLSDNGIGIDQAYFKTIFDPFTQVDTSSTRQCDGVGIGLSLCKQLVEQMGGEIWAGSELDKGSTFYFTLPFKRTDAKELFTRQLLKESLTNGLKESHQTDPLFQPDIDKLAPIIQKLYKALIESDPQKIEKSISEIKAYDIPKKSVLIQRIYDYDYDEAVLLLKEVAAEIEVPI